MALYCFACTSIGTYNYINITIVRVCFVHCAGESRVVEEVLTSMLGPEAAYDNTLINPIFCAELNNSLDGLKEGNILSLLRLETTDTGVCSGRDQALVIELANGGLS